MDEENGGMANYPDTDEPDDEYNGYENVTEEVIDALQEIANRLQPRIPAEYRQQDEIVASERAMEVVMVALALLVPKEEVDDEGFIEELNELLAERGYCVVPIEG